MSRPSRRQCPKCGEPLSRPREVAARLEKALVDCRLLPDGVLAETPREAALYSLGYIDGSVRWAVADLVHRCFCECKNQEPDSLAIYCSSCRRRLHRCDTSCPAPCPKQQVIAAIRVAKDAARGAA